MRYLKLSVLLSAVVLLVVGAAGLANADSDGRSVAGMTYYVDTCGAPFAPHSVIFHADGTLTFDFPDAAEKNNSASTGNGKWRVKNNKVIGRFFEINADRATNKATGTLVVTFTLTVKGRTFEGPALATYNDTAGVPIPGLEDLPANLKGQRQDIGDPAPVFDPCTPVARSDGAPAPIAGPRIALATPWQSLTIYRNQNWSGDSYTFNLLNYNHQCVNFGSIGSPFWSERAQSVYQNATGYVTLYQYWSCGGNVTTTTTATSPWKQCQPTNPAYGPWSGSCTGSSDMLGPRPSSMYVHIS